MRFLIRLGVLMLAAFGAKTLYEKYAPRAQELKEPANDFIDRAKGAVDRTAEQVTNAAQQMTGAAKDMTGEIRSAADDAAHDAAQCIDDTDQPARGRATSGV